MNFLAIGDSCSDVFIYGECKRICPEAPVPVLTPTFKNVYGGMAKNVKKNIESLGGNCDVITNTSEILKTRYVDSKTNQMLLRVDEFDQTEDSFNSSKVEYGKYDGILVSNYNKGFLKEGDIYEICRNHNNVFYDSKMPFKRDLPVNLKILKINQYELELSPLFKLTIEKETNDGLHFSRPDQIIVTYGGKGCKYMGRMYAPPQYVVSQDLSGAGDTFFAALAYSMTENKTVIDSIHFANSCASTVVTRRGISTI